MAQYRLEILSTLARQLEFAPQDVRLTQVNAAEALLHDIDSTKAYPQEFVVFRITGYHPKSLSAEMLAGQAIQHDLGLLIESVSQSLSVETSAICEPVLSIDDVAERFSVTSKTIQRWRRKGLPARRFVFPDGKLRVGFLLSSVERFFSGHRDQVTRGTNFSQMDQAERDEIVRRARRLSGHRGCAVREISRRIARKLNRSPLTILHTIRKFDQEHPDQAIFSQAGQEVSDLEKQRILKGHRRGLAIATLAKRFCRARSAVYRVVLEDRIDRITRRKIRFIDDPLYHQDDAAAVIEQIESQDELDAQATKEELRVPRDLPAYFQALYRTPLLTPARERALFLKFNFRKYQFVAARRKLETEFARLREVERLEEQLAAAAEVKNAILQANLRLVVSVARKHVRPGINLMELVSDGNITLMRAVEGFDIHRGNRFSTYATLALMKGFARSVPQMLASKRVSGGPTGSLLEAVPDHRQVFQSDAVADQEQVRVLLSKLSERERMIVSAHFGLDRSTPATFEKLGAELGLTKHRVREIEKLALAKLRQAQVCL